MQPLLVYPAQGLFYNFFHQLIDSFLMIHVSRFTMYFSRLMPHVPQNPLSFSIPPSHYK